MKKTWQTSFKFIFFIALVAVFVTVFVSDSLLCQGVITAKYFWFAVTMCIAVIFWFVVLLLGALPVSRKLSFADYGVALLVVYICINYFLLNEKTSMHWWLFLLLIPLYIMMRTACVDQQLKRLVLGAILGVVLVETIWGMLQLHGFVQSYHGLYKITGSFFNPGPYSGFVAAGIPLAMAYALDKTLSGWERWLGKIVLIAALLVLPAAMSRAAWLGAIFGSILVLWSFFGKSYFRFHLKKKTRRIVAVISCVVIAGLLVVMYFLE